MPYLEQIETLAELLPPGGLYHVHVEHDAKCPFLAGGPCTCTPIITLHDEGCPYLTGGECTCKTALLLTPAEGMTTEAARKLSNEKGEVKR